MKASQYLRLISYLMVIACVCLYESGTRVIPLALTAPEPELDLDGILPRPSDCPFHHHNLREVPIVYGLLEQDVELEAQFERLELWRGGCVIGPWSRDSKLVCLTCKFAYDDVHLLWEKSVSVAEVAESPDVDLSSLLAQMPIPVDLEKRKNVRYEVSLKGRRVWAEGCRYAEKRDFVEWQNEIVGFLRARGIVAITRENRNFGDARFSGWAQFGTRYLTIDAIRDWTGVVRVHIQVLSDDAAADDISLQIEMKKMPNQALQTTPVTPSEI